MFSQDDLRLIAVGLMCAAHVSRTAGQTDQADRFYGLADKADRLARATEGEEGPGEAEAHV